MPFISLDVLARCLCTMHDASINLHTSLHMVREATSSQVWPSARFADGGNRGKDHVRDDLWLRDHDHVGALDLGDRRPGALSHGTDEIGRASCRERVSLNV